MSDEMTGSGGFQAQKRLPYADRRIDELTQDDIKVRVAGAVIEKSDDTLIIDDGTGQVKVMTESPRGFDINNIIRVFGRVIPVEGGIEISGEILQDMSDVNMELYKKTQYIEKALGV